MSKYVLLAALFSIVVSPADGSHSARGGMLAVAGDGSGCGGGLAIVGDGSGCGGGVAAVGDGHGSGAGGLLIV